MKYQPSEQIFDNWAASRKWFLIWEDTYEKTEYNPMQKKQLYVLPNGSFVESWFDWYENQDSHYWRLVILNKMKE